VGLAEPDSATARAFRQMAERVAAEVERRNADAPPTQPIEILYK
jgi:ATP-binding protein involved in chromosome partitioning